jgi:hypothetical protein
LQNSPLESSCVVVALIENYNTSKLLKVCREKSQILNCDTVVANELYILLLYCSSTSQRDVLYKKKINLAFRPAVQLWINDEFPSNYLALVHRLNVFLALNYELQFKRSALFCDFTQRRLVVCFRSFGEAYRFDLQWVQHCLTLRKLPWQTANLHCVRSQKSAYFFYTAAESWNRVKLRT